MYLVGMESKAVKLKLVKDDDGDWTGDRISACGRFAVSKSGYEDWVRYKVYDHSHRLVSHENHMGGIRTTVTPNCIVDSLKEAKAWIARQA